VGQAYDQWNVVNSFMVEKKCLCHVAQPIAEFIIGLAGLRER
jgi:hypothetical protein